MPIENYRDLEIWQNGIEFVKQIYQVTAKFPSDEKYDIIAQMKRFTMRILKYDLLPATYEILI